MSRTPGICYHKGAQRYYVTLDGAEVYLGPRQPRRRSPPAEVRRAYDRVLAAWLAERSRPPRPQLGADPTVGELWAAFLPAVESRYSRGVASERKCVSDACKVADELFGHLRAAEFGPKSLLAVRDAYCARGWSRRYVNQQVCRLRRMFRWAVREELLPVEVWQRLLSVQDLRKGEVPGLPEQRKVPDVPDAVVAATLAAARPSLSALVMAHRLIGCRADEACSMRARDLERLPDPESPTGELWRFRPRESKNDEVYWVGPRAQAVLLPLLDVKRPEAPLFVAGSGVAYTAKAYHNAVERAAKRAGQPHWTPLQLRHAAAEEARQAHPKGIEATQARLRHAEVRVSQVYAHNRDLLGMDVARRLG